MIDTASESERFCPENRGGRRRAGFALVGIVAALGFCANATPALASDGVEPPPLVPELGVSEEIPPLPQLDVDETAVVPVPEEPPIVIDTSLEGDDVDVSIRVLSPGENELEAPVDATSDVISETLEPDITTDPVLADTLPTPTIPIEQEAVNTNISIRVLSPGRNGIVDQDSGLATGAPAEPTPDEAPFEDVGTASEAEDAPEVAEEQPQYHEGNTRYQLDDISAEDPWVWEWYLSLDCSGNVTSISSEIGSPSSRDWAWNWIWDWTCGLDGASEESGDALQEGFASIASVDSPRGPAGAAGGTSATPGQQPDSSGEPWLWTWTFNFCGRETTFSIQAGAQTSLAWTWDWTWAWACTSAEVVSPTPGEEGYGEGPSGPAADPGTPAGELELPPPLEIVAEPFFASTLFTAPPTVGPFVIAAPISIAPAIPIARTLPTGSGLEPAPASGPGRARAPAPVPVLTPAQVPVATVPTGIHTATATPISAEDHRARPASSRDREASPRPARRLPQLPLGPARRAAGSSTSSGGAAPGGGAASGVAALTGFYVLAAPGLGRRLRVVRELSPRARSEAPLDRPG